MKTNIINLTKNERSNIRLFRAKGDKLMLPLFLAAMMWSALSIAHVQADALTGLYTQVAVGDPDFQGGYNAGGNLGNGLVQSQLGPDGLPVLSAAGINRLGTSSDMNLTTDELLWWSAGADPYVSLDLNPVQINAMPLNYGYPLQNWYPTGQTGDQNYYRTVHFVGTFTMASAGQITLSLQADDDAWGFIDGALATEFHYGDNAVVTSTDVSAGTHTLDLFYDDRFPTFDQMVFSSSVALSPVPEPGVISLFMAGMVSLIACGWRRQNQG